MENTNRNNSLPRLIGKTKRLMHCYKNLQRAKTVEKGLGPHSPAGRIILTLQKCESMGRRSLATILDIPRPVLKDVLDELEARGLICQTRDENHPHHVQVSLTEKGTDEKIVCPDMDEVLSVLTDEERDALASGLSKLVGRLEELTAGHEVPHSHRHGCGHHHHPGFDQAPWGPGPGACPPGPAWGPMPPAGPGQFAPQGWDWQPAPPSFWGRPGARGCRPGRRDPRHGY